MIKGNCDKAKCEFKIFVTENHKSTPPTSRYPELNSVGLTLNIGDATYATLLWNRLTQQQRRCLGH